MMLMRRPIAMSILLGAALGIGGMQQALPIGTQQDISLPKRTTPQPRNIGRGTIANWHHHTNGPGWTAAQVKRMSRKRRNQAAHKRACRGKRS